MKVFDYETLEVGEDLGTRTIRITDDLVREYTSLIETDHPWYRETSPYGGRIAPPTIFDNETLRMIDTVYARFGSIHAKQSWDFRKAVRVGATIRVNVRLAEKFVKRDKGWMVLELTAIDESGDVVCRGRHTSAVSLVAKPGGDRPEDAREWPGDARSGDDR
jgi:acyl dehydratase